MRVAKWIFGKGIWGCTGFPLLRWENGSETPSCGGEKGLRLPRSSCSDLGSEGVSDPFPTARGRLRPFCPPQKGKPRTSPNPLSENPLSATHESVVILDAQNCLQWGRSNLFDSVEWPKTTLIPLSVLFSFPVLFWCRVYPRFFVVTRAFGGSKCAILCRNF